MRKIILLVLSVIALSAKAQTSLIADGGFENQPTFQNNQLPRIAGFGELGNLVQKTNPTIDREFMIERGQWFKKASNSGYLTASIIDSDSYAGKKCVLLSVGKNSPQKNLDKWETTAIAQFVEIERTKSYTLRFYAKSNIDCDKIFVGAVTGNGSVIEGSTWVDITPDWKEYSLTITPGVHPKSGGYTNKLLDRSAVVIGLATKYDNNDRSIQISVLLDNIDLIPNE